MLQTSSLAYSVRPAAGTPETGQTELTIRQMAELHGVSLRTLRFYEARGLLSPRREGDARFYRAAERARMEMILQGKRLGFTLSEITDLLGGRGANDNDSDDLEMRLDVVEIVLVALGALEQRIIGEVAAMQERDVA